MIYAIGTSQYHILSNHVAYACNVEVLHDENCKWWIHGWPYLDRDLLYNMPFAYCMGPTFACIGMWTGDFCFFIFQSFHYAHFQLWSADFFQIFQKKQTSVNCIKIPVLCAVFCWHVRALQLSDSQQTSATQVGWQMFPLRLTTFMCLVRYPRP